VFRILIEYHKVATVEATTAKIPELLHHTMDRLKRLDPAPKLGYASPLPAERDNYVGMTISELNDEQLCRVAHVYYLTLTTQVKVLCLTV
jgi:hypothetical protein